MFTTRNSIKDSLGCFAVFIWVSGVVGWIINLIQIVYHLNDPITKLWVLRIIGAFLAPLGSILGLFVW